jgi:hypothetical protein
MGLQSFSITSAQAVDIPAILAIGKAAMLDDKQTQFKNLAKIPSPSKDNGTNLLFADWLANPRCTLLKAVDDKTGEILVSSCWATRGYGEKSNDRTTQAEPKATQKEEHGEPATKVSEDPVDRLNAFTSDDFAQWMDKIMPIGIKCRFICAISVHPKHQGRGIDKVLIRWGTEQADKDGVFCWVHASGWISCVPKKRG